MNGLLKLAVAMVLASCASATTYANFCDDTACSVNCGESVSVDNPGCLQESGRLSVAFHDTNAQTANLVYSPDDACSCQQYCEENIVGVLQGDSCKGLTGPPSNSYRFVGTEGCDVDNC